MTRMLLIAGTTLGLVGAAQAKSATSGIHAQAARGIPPPPPRISVHPAPPLPMQPEVTRVRVEVARDRVVILQEVTLPRGDWEAGGLDLYVAFGAPGTPIAVDARLLTNSHGNGEAHGDDATEEVSVDPAPRRGSAAQPLLGRPQMAGVVLHVRESQLRRAYAAADAVLLRIRSLLSPPVADAQGARDVVVRLGSSAGLPLTLARIQLVSLESTPWVTRVEAHLCGLEADPWPLSITLSPAPEDGRARAPTISPEMAVRHASDDLCVTWWAPP